MVINSLPHLEITLEEDDFIHTKDYYLSANLKIDGKNTYDDFEGSMGIRGRGNSSWTFPKKPYKIKLDQSASLFGLAPHKKWVLLAEYLDGSMLYNSVPFKAGELLGIPYTNTIIPVEISINGNYQGIYAFTEDKEVTPQRIDLGPNGVLLELDTYFDEEWQFISENFNLPVMVQYPEEDDINLHQFNTIKSDFEYFESLIYDSSFPNNEYLDFFDDLSFVNYLIVYQLTANREINHPKSTYINKLENGKYRMGILWDFDWAYGLDHINGEHYALSSIDYPLLYSDEISSGTRFFSRLMEDPHLQALFKERWQWFKSTHFHQLKQYVKEYASSIQLGYENDHEVWGARNASGNFDEDLNKMLLWLDGRANYIDQYVVSFPSIED